MTAIDAPERLPRFERDLREALREDAGLERPEYLSDVLLRTVEARQRPAWTFPERWLPMSVVTSRTVPIPRLPLRALAVVLLIIVLAAAAALYAGSRPRLPAPFGRASNGLVAYARNGDIYTADPVTGKATAIVTGSSEDSNPVWSLDGTMLAFVREGRSDGGQLMVTAVDGSGVRAITQSLPGVGVYDATDSRHVNLAFSPDGREVAFTSGDSPTKSLWVADVRQGVARQLNLGMSIDAYDEPTWRPPAGDELLFTGVSAADPSTLPGGATGDGPSGLYAIDVQSGKVRPIVTPTEGHGVGVPTWSPDGSRVAFDASDQTTDRPSYQVHVVNSDGSGNVTLPLPRSALFQDRPIWSNDGTRLMVARGYAAQNQDMRLAIVPADGSNTGIETTKPQITGCCDTFYAWSPDDSTILVLPEDLNGILTAPLLVDPTTGAVTDASWAGISMPAWQRRSP